MPTQKFVNRNIRKLIKLGQGTLVVSLPKDMTALLGWKEKQKVVIKRKGKSLIIRDWKKR